MHFKEIHNKKSRENCKNLKVHIEDNAGGKIKLKKFTEIRENSRRIEEKLAERSKTLKEKSKDHAAEIKNLDVEISKIKEQVTIIPLSRIEMIARVSNANKNIETSSSSGSDIETKIEPISIHNETPQFNNPPGITPPTVRESSKNKSLDCDGNSSSFNTDRTW